MEFLQNQMAETLGMERLEERSSRKKERLRRDQELEQRKLEEHQDA